MIGILAVAGALAFGACEQSARPGSAERGATTSAPASRGPGGEPGARTSGTERGSAGMASSSSSSSSMAPSGTGGSGDAGFGARDGGMR
jgi:hypothetical protein